MVVRRAAAVVMVCVAGFSGNPVPDAPRGLLPTALQAAPPFAAPRVRGPAGPPPFAFREGELARVIAAYQALPNKADRSSFDVAALAGKIGGDPVLAFAFVRDHIAEEIYPGVLRGPAGTLQAGAGNDLDRSLLLAALLSGPSAGVRFARCTLAPAAAERRVAAMFGGSALPRADDDVSPAFGIALTEAGLFKARSAEIVAARQQARQWLSSAMLGTARDDLEVMRAALGKAGIAPAPTTPDPRILEDARDHVWLQVARGETWLDLDPSVPGDRPGGTMCAPASTVDSLPAAVYQTITFTLRNQYVEGQSLRDDTVLSHQFRVSDLYGQVIGFVNVGVPPSSTLLQSGTLERFIPFARTRNGAVVGREFAAVPGAQATAAAAADALGGGEDPPVLGAQWLDFAIDAPGRRTTGSRALVDVIVPSERRTGVILTRPDPDVTVLALAEGAAVAVSAGQIHPLAAIETAYRDVDPAAVGRAFDVPLQRTLSDESPESDATNPEDAMLAGLALAYATHIERALVDLGAAERLQMRLIRDQPALTIVNLVVRQRIDGKGAVVDLAVDLRHDRVRVVPRSLADTVPAFWANVLRGLVDGALEHHLPALTIPAAHESSRARPTQVDTTGLLELARAQGVEVRALFHRTTPNLRALLAEAGGIGLAGELQDDTAVVMPTRPVQAEDERRFAMWTVDLTNGHVLSLLDTGLRGQATEEGRQVRLINFLQTNIRRCVAAGGNMARCRQMFQMWADAANRLRELRHLPGRINVTNGNFTGFTF